MPAMTGPDGLEGGWTMDNRDEMSDFDRCVREAVRNHAAAIADAIPVAIIEPPGQSLAGSGMCIHAVNSRALLRLATDALAVDHRKLRSDARSDWMAAVALRAALKAMDDWPNEVERYNAAWHRIRDVFDRGGPEWEQLAKKLGV